MMVYIIGPILEPVLMVSDLWPFFKACADGLSLRAIFEAELMV